MYVLINAFQNVVIDPKPSSSFSYFRPSAKKNPLKRLQAKKREGDLEKKKKEERKEREDDLEKKKKEERKKLFGKAMKGSIKFNFLFVVFNSSVPLITSFNFSSEFI